jgi:hypothetical protein
MGCTLVNLLPDSLGGVDILSSRYETRILLLPLADEHLLKLQPYDIDYPTLEDYEGHV